MLIYQQKGLKKRIRRHVSEVLRLSWPVIVARSSVMAMALVDTVMVGRFSTTELAFLSIGLVPFVPVYLIMLGLVMGTVVMSAAAYGRGDFKECGAVWSRSIPYAIVLGMFGCLISCFGEKLLQMGGQSVEMASHGGQVMFILGLGLPAYLVTITSSLFLEGIKKPKPAMVFIIIANLINIGLNWVFVYGNMGVSAMGAEGSAIATTTTRCLLAIVIVTYILKMSCRKKFGISVIPVDGWRKWAEQRRVGYSSAFSIGGETIGFACIGLFAGWLGEITLAAYTIAHNLIAMAFMVSLGVASATVVRVGIAKGSGDMDDVKLAGWVGLGVNTIFMGLIGVGFGLFPNMFASVYTNDSAVIFESTPLIIFCGFVIIVDGGQVVMINALRGAGGIWAPALIQIFSFLIVMVPLGWWLAIKNGYGGMGLYEAIFFAAILSLSLLSLQFMNLNILRK